MYIWMRHKSVNSRKDSFTLMWIISIKLIKSRKSSVLLRDDMYVYGTNYRTVPESF